MIRGTMGVLRRAALVAALGALLVLAAPAGATPVVASKLTLTAPKSQPAPGGTVEVVATLTQLGKPLAGKSVALVAGAQQLATGNTDPKGKVTFEVTVDEAVDIKATYVPAPPDAAAIAPSTSNTVHLAPAVGLKLRVDSYLHAGRKTVAVPGTKVSIRGSVSPLAPGQQVTIDIFKGNNRVKHKLRPVKPGAQGKGTFALSFKPGGRGNYTVRVSSDAASPKRVHVYVVKPSAHLGDRGTGTRALQSRLAALGYLTPVTGHFNASTARAVLAFRKVNGYARTSSAGGAVFNRLARGGGGFRLKYPKGGKHAEFDWSRQVLVLARGGKPVKILTASSGKPSTPTVFGKFHFYRKTPGFNSHGMYYSNYFIGGYAIHGYAEVPTYAASHGCIRIPIPSATSVYKWVNVGDAIYVYR